MHKYRVTEGRAVSVSFLCLSALRRYNHESLPQNPDFYHTVCDFCIKTF
jgi:hypothetical protein